MNMTLQRALVICAVCLIGALGQEAFCEEPVKQVVRVRGSDSMTHLVTVYASEFHSSKPDCNLLISGGTQHDVGIQDLLTGEAEISMSTFRVAESELKQAKETGLDIQEAIVGWGAIVIIVHPSNPVASLTVEQVRKLLVGELTSWSDVGGPSKPVAVVAVNDTIRSGDHKFLTEVLLKHHFAPSAQLVSYFRSIPATVAENPGAIGVVRMRNLERIVEEGKGQTIKVVAIKKEVKSPGSTPTRESIDEGIYPITRPFYLYVATNKANTCAMDFFRFCEARNPRAHKESTTGK